MNRISRHELPSAEAYVGLPASPEIEQQPLSEQMGAYELSIILGCVNTEKKGVALGSYSEQPRTLDDAYSELLESGVFSLEHCSRTSFCETTKGFPPGIFIEGTMRGEDGEHSRAYALTPLGMTTRGVAGQFLDFGLRTGVRLEDLLGQRIFLSPDKIMSASKDPAFSQITRLYLLLSVGNPENSRIIQQDLRSSLDKRFGIGHHMFSRHLKSLVNSNLAKVDKNGRVNRREIVPTEKLTEIHGELGELVTALIKRDPDVIAEGNAKMDSLLSDPRLPYLFKRSFVGKERFPASLAKARLAVEILNDCGRRMTTTEIYEEAVERGFVGTQENFYFGITTVLTIKDPPLEAELGGTGNDTYWWLPQKPNGDIATAARSYGRSLELK